MVKRSKEAAKKVGENLDKLLAGTLPTRKEPKSQVQTNAEIGRESNPKIQELHDGFKKWKEEGSPRLKDLNKEQEEIKITHEEGEGEELIIQRERLLLPRLGKLISDFALENSDVLRNKNLIFYRPDFGDIVEIGKIKLHKTGKEKYTGFLSMNPNRYVTLVEKFIEPGIEEYNPDKRQWIFKPKSIGSNLALIILSSADFQQSLPQIERIFSVPLPIIYEEKLTFPRKGYDIRFSSWLPYSCPEISNPNMELEKAKDIIHSLFKEFCFKTKQDYINAIAGLITPFLRGLFPEFNTRTPLIFNIANRERCGKDYLAGITSILYEGYVLEEPAISTEDKGYGNNSEELRKKITGAMIRGRKRLHFSNNKGYINNPILEGIITNKRYSDRPLGKSDIKEFDNEMDYSLSGNIGVRWTADLGNRSRFVRLFLSMEDANKRQFNNPNLHRWVKQNRELVLSALYSLVRNWYNNGSKPGTIPFASFPEWAEVCGGIMESAGYDSPCTPDEETLTLSGDLDTQNMKTLYEYCYESYPDEWIKKKDMKLIIQNSQGDLFNDLDFNVRTDQMKFSDLIDKFIGRELSGITLKIKKSNSRSDRNHYFFTKKVEEIDKNDIFQNEGFINL